MKKYLTYIIFGFLPIFSFSQNFSGSWSGIITKPGQKLEQGDIIYLKIEGNKNIEGLTRIELHEDELEFAVKSFKGKINGNKIEIEEDLNRRSSKTRKSPECKLNYELTYDSKTAYLKGSYLSSDCRGMQGDVLFFRSDAEVTIEKTPSSTHSWKYFFLRNYEKGYPAPELMKKEQINFKFQTIHFEYDKSEIRPEYFDYLNQMARVLDGIHDLRVKITGHTDSDGTDEYNMDLSERRADALRAYFKSKGVEPGKLEIDFQGKRQPLESNQTREGRKKNRRVVFEFI